MTTGATPRGASEMLKAHAEIIGDGTITLGDFVTLALLKDEAAALDAKHARLLALAEALKGYIEAEVEDRATDPEGDSGRYKRARWDDVLEKYKAVTG